MVNRRVALPAVGVGMVAAGGVAGWALVHSWSRNPDPLDGRPIRFPDGDRRRVEVPDGAVIDTVAVGEGPTIVLVHGLTASKNDWAPIAPALLDAGYRLLAIDQRGHGRSTRGTAGYGATQLAADLDVVLRELDVTAAALVGHSMGGMTAMAFAVGHRVAFEARVGTLVLVATAASLATFRHRLGLVVGGVRVPSALFPADDRLRLGAGLGVFGRAPSLHMVDAAIDMFRECPDDVRAEATAALRSHDVADLLDRIHAPTLVVGAGRDQLIRPSQVRALARGIDGARLEMFPKAGHMVHWEHNAELARLIIDHLVDQRG